MRERVPLIRQSGSIRSSSTSRGLSVRMMRRRSCGVPVSSGAQPAAEGASGTKRSIRRSPSTTAPTTTVTFTMPVAGEAGRPGGQPRCRPAGGPPAPGEPPSILGALGPDAAAVRLDEPLADGEPEAVARRRALSRAGVLAEQVRQPLGRDPAPPRRRPRRRHARFSTPAATRIGVDPGAYRAAFAERLSSTCTTRRWSAITGGAAPRAGRRELHAGRRSGRCFASDPPGGHVRGPSRSRSSRASRAPGSRGSSCRSPAGVPTADSALVADRRQAFRNQRDG